MKLIVNRGFDKIFTRIIVFKNTEKILSCPMKQDYCEFEAKEGERIIVKLKYPDSFTFTIASIDCNGNNDTFYISPTRLFKNWSLVNYMILPGFCFLFYVLQKTTVSDVYSCFFTGLMVLWALLLICMGFGLYIPFMHKKMFKLIKL